MTTTTATPEDGTPDEPLSDAYVDGACVTVLDQLEAAASATNRVPLGLPTSFRDLDTLTGGLEPGTLTIIAARPGMGRTTLLTDICRVNAIKHSTPTLVYTLEESRENFTRRILSAECRVSSHHVRSGTMTDEDWKRFAKRMPAVSAAPLLIKAPARINMLNLALEAAEDVEQHDVKLIAVDGIQDIRPDRRSDLREREVGDIVRDLKTMARELNVAVVATSHLNRAPEQRWDRVPLIDDLRESGAITYAADTVVLLHRPDAYVRDSERAGEADLIVGKLRGGPAATITVAFQGHYGRFVDMAQT
ncbi:DnaB-like helicase C-terminal domain-containing protein [Streptomyces olivaceiscleroticus]|uniref:SF4 helicase domain-containing protein n=1 Tax=Streptomyces olivaceiscleroticus TaxID=68245 RepID=A0ABP3LJ96_9ACTN